MQFARATMSGGAGYFVDVQAEFGRRVNAVAYATRSGSWLWLHVQTP
jgi:hypothetical protein